MKIGIIVRGLTNGGVKRFLKSIITELRLYKKNHEFYLIHDDQSIYENFSDFKQFYIKNQSKLKFDYWTSFWLIKKLNLDIVLYPKNVIPLTHFLLNSKKINIIHDLGYFEKDLNAYPFLDTFFMRTFIGISCRKSSTILAVSQSTKNFILKRFNLPEEKIKVIYEGVEKNFNNRSRKKN